MKNTLSLIFLLFFTQFVLLSQEREIPIKEYFEDAEFFLAQEYYIDALYDFMEVYNNGYQDNANINYRIGICYLNIPGQKAKAIEYFKKAEPYISSKYKTSMLRETNAPLDLYLYMGNAYRVINELDEAIVSFNKYKLLVKKQTPEVDYANSQIVACQTAKRLMSNPVRVAFMNVGEPVNTNSANRRAVVSGDGNTMVYVTSLPFYDAVYITYKEDGKWTEPVNLTAEILSDGDQYVTDISYDGTQLLLTREDEFDSDIYLSSFDGQRWSKSDPLIDVNTSFWEGHACFSQTADTIYFTSNRPGGYGGSDIYMIAKAPEGGWSNAQNLGGTINTELNEDTPFLTDDGKTMFFSSQAYENMGGYDVFVSYSTGKGGWLEPQNLCYPINTTDDDLFYYPIQNGRFAYVSRYTTDGYGDYDIYITGNPDEPIFKDLKKIEEPIEPITAMGDTTKRSVDEHHEVVPAVVPKVKLQVNPIYFEFDRSALSEHAKLELLKVQEFMKAHPDVKMELTGHTDNVGTAAYNLELSKRRASEAVDYFVRNGIAKERLSFDGKGESENVAINTNPDGSDNKIGRRYNRRVEIHFIDYDTTKYDFEYLNPVPKELQK